MRTKHIIPKHAAQFSYAHPYAFGEAAGGGGGGGDPFADFPDAVLGLIVSYLPFKAAVAASAISRRWRGAVSAAPVLDLDFAAAFPAAPRRRAAFAAAATAALALSHHPLRRLRLALEGLFDPAFGASAAEHLASWLAAAAARGVEQLELHLPRARHAVLPSTLLACTKISSLTLRLDHYAFPLPFLSPFTRLSRLHLASISLSGEDFFKDLFLHCTKLSHLILQGCRISELRLAGAQQLCSLTIIDCSWTPPSLVTVSAMPALQALHYAGSTASTHIIDSTGPLDEVVLDIQKPVLKCQEYDVTKLVALVGNVRSLLLSPWCIEQFVRTEERLEVWLDKVRRLACIIERREEGALSVAQLLVNCPNVEELSVSVVPSQCRRRRCGDDMAGRGELAGRKEVMMRHLRGVRMEYIDESKAGLALVKLLLKNAPVLELMTIVPSTDGLEQAKFRRRVVKLRKASRDAKIRFSTAG